MMQHFFGDENQWLSSAAAIAVALVVSMIVHRAAFAVAAPIAARTHGVADKSFLRHARKPIGLILPIVGILVLLPELPIPANIKETLSHLIGLILIGGMAWLLVRCTKIADDVVKTRYGVDAEDVWQARRVQTQVQMLRRIAVTIVWFVAFSMMLMTFPDIRHLGATLFASAGIAGVVIGIAARPVLSNLICGLQLALTEPIRLKDTIVVDGENGTVEEIAATYVVVRTWDLRAMIVPLSYFIEKSFQNWTYQGTELLGPVILYTDYDVAIDEVRDELKRILAATTLWDGKVGNLQLTEATEHTLQLRALVSARDSENLGDLRCLVREKLVAFLQQRYPGSLPKVRIQLSELRRSLEDEA